MLSRKKLVTSAEYASFEGRPDFKDELIDGRIAMSPAPSRYHGIAVENVMDAIRPACRGTKFLVTSQPQHLKLSKLFEPIPDLMIVKEAIWYSPSNPNSNYYEGIPLLVVEVLSPDEKVGNKASKYIRDGLLTVWEIDLKTWKVHVSTQKGNPHIYHHTDHIPLPQPLANSLKVEDFFAGEPKPEDL